MSERETLASGSEHERRIHAADDAEILAARARWLAREDEADEGAEDRIEVIEFRQGAERCGVESRHVQEVCRLGDFTTVPCTPAFVLGIMNVHGRIFSVIDLAKLLGLPASQVSDRSRVVILRCDEMEFGILVDEISGLTSVASRRLQPPLPTITALGTDLLKGITDDCLVVLDGERILADPRIVVEQDVDASSESSRPEGE